MEEPTEVTCPDSVVKEAEYADPLMQWVMDEDYENNPEWGGFLGDTEIRPPFVGSKHAKRVAVWANSVAREAIDQWVADGYPLPLTMPDGACIVKNNYNMDDVPQLMARTVMYKDSTLDSEQYPSQWYFVKATPDHAVVQNCEVDPAVYVAGAPKGCTGCHNGSTNFGLFPDPEATEPEVGGQQDAIVPYDYVITAYCADPATECDHTEVVPDEPTVR